MLLLLVVLGLVISVILALKSLYPPEHLTMAAGPENGGYSRVAERYRRILAGDNITLNIVHTAGSKENADLLSDGRVDAAILQGGVEVVNDEIEAIAAIFSESMIFLARENVDVPDNPALWRDLRISSGRAGSGTAEAFSDFQAAVGLEPSDNIQLALSYGDVVTALVAGRIDVAVFVAPFDSPYLAQAYDHPSIRLVSSGFSEAIARRMRYARTAIIPTGAISLRPVTPKEPRKIIALEARLAIVPDLHPALVNRLTMAATIIHDEHGVISDSGDFPTIEGTDLPVNNVARQLILDGPSTWHDWLPYWMAAQINRLLLLSLPVIFVLLPLLYGYFMGWRVWHYYPEIRSIEEELRSVSDTETLGQIDGRLTDLDEHLSQLQLPLAYRRTAYDARVHIELVRKRIRKMQQDAVSV